MTLRALALLITLALAAPVQADILTKDAAARKLIIEGRNFETAGKLSEALASYRAAAKADPAASEPLSYMAWLRDMLRFHNDGQLQAAIFALHYKEIYREDFEAWKKAEPEGLKRFVDTFRVGL